MLCFIPEGAIMYKEPNFHLLWISFGFNLELE